MHTQFLRDDYEIMNIKTFLKVDGEFSALLLTKL